MRYKCNICDSTNVTVKIEETARDNVPAEVSYKCNLCGESAFFSYGHYEENRFNFSIIEDNKNPIFGTV